MASSTILFPASAIAAASAVVVVVQGSGNEGARPLRKRKRGNATTDMTSGLSVATSVVKPRSNRPRLYALKAAYNAHRRVYNSLHNPKIVHKFTWVPPGRTVGTVTNTNVWHSIVICRRCNEQIFSFASTHKHANIGACYTCRHDLQRLAVEAEAKLTAEEKALFAAYRGMREDGHRRIAAAFEARHFNTDSYFCVLPNDIFAQVIHYVKHSTPFGFEK